MNTAKEYKARVAVIDDDMELQELITAFFRQKNIETISFDDPETALQQIKKDKLSCDVIICDLQLPNLTGIEFTFKVKQLGVETPIIIMTAHKAVETALEAIHAGAYDFVVKPLHFPQLLVSVERAIYLGKIQKDNLVLTTTVKMQTGNISEGIIGKSEGLKTAMDLARRVAPSTANVFITGESGSGKEVIARMIHNLSPRKDKPFIALNCSAIPETLLESELFGHAKGSFTGAVDKKIGLFEEADAGTLFLDEIGDLSLPLQAKLLRVLQERKIKRIGENQMRDIDVRILSATHKDLHEEIVAKRFREDLFFRLNVIPIQIPPLRERKEDIIPLAEYFLRKFALLNGSRARGFSKDALEWLLHQVWPGNVRELENVIERAVVLCSGEQITRMDLPEIERGHFHAKSSNENSFDWRNLSSNDRFLTIDQLVKQYIKYALNKNHGAKEKTAKELDIDRKTLYKKIRELESEATIQ